MNCTFSHETIEDVISFHGHSCPGVAIGIRAAEYAIQELGKIEQNNILCVTETDMCGVDAIQFLTGCTFGKGNLIHRDYGKMAFSFYNRESDQGFRLLLNNSSLARKTGSSKEDMIVQIMDTPLENLFNKTFLETPPPRSARVLQSLVCETCGESTMESRTRRFEGKTFCIPCFKLVDQKE